MLADPLFYMIDRRADLAMYLANEVNIFFPSQDSFGNFWRFAVLRPIILLW